MLGWTAGSWNGVSHRCLKPTVMDSALLLNGCVGLYSLSPAKKLLLHLKMVCLPFQRCCFGIALGSVQVDNALAAIWDGEVAFPMLCFSSWSLLAKLPRQPPSLGSFPAFIYLLMLEVCLSTSFLSFLCLAWGFDHPSEATYGCLNWHMWLGGLMMSVRRSLHWCVRELGWVHWGYSCASISSN